MTPIITTHTNHSPGGAQRSSHTTATILRLGFDTFNMSSQIFCEHRSIYGREILVGHLFSEGEEERKRRVLVHLMVRACFRCLAGSRVQRGGVGLPALMSAFLHPVLR